MNWRHTFTALPTAAFSEGKAQGISRWLVQHAARSAPAALSERLEEEWLADLATRSGRMAQLRFGIGCCWATRVIAHEHGAVAVPATPTITGQKIMTAYAQHALPYFSRRTTIFFLIVGLHVFLIYALKTGLGSTLVKIMPTTMHAEVLQDPQKVIDPPPPPPLNFVRPTLDAFPIPDVFTDDPVDTNTIQAVAQPTVEAPPSAPVQPRVVNRAVGGPGKGFPNTEDFYPVVSRRLGEEGTAITRVCVDEKGRLTEQPSLAQSSGSARLDEGALKLAKAGSGHYRATSEDGQPVSSCYAFRIKFQMKQ
jgi:protein TonB